VVNGRRVGEEREASMERVIAQGRTVPFHARDLTLVRGMKGTAKL